MAYGQRRVDRHHRNSDRMDNRRENIEFLCKRHHNAAHKLTDGQVGGGPRPRIVALLRDRALEQWSRAIVLRAQGYSNPEIASELFVHRDSVKRWFAKYGTALR